MGETLNSDEGNASSVFVSSDKLEDISESDETENKNTIVTQLSADTIKARL